MRSTILKVFGSVVKEIESGEEETFSDARTEKVRELFAQLDQ